MLNKLICFFTKHQFYSEYENAPCIEFNGALIAFRGIAHKCARCEKLIETKLIVNITGSTISTTHNHKHLIDLKKLMEHVAEQKSDDSIRFRGCHHEAQEGKG